MNILKATLPIIVFSIATSFPVLTFADQSTNDVESLNKLKQIHSILLQNTQKNYTCIDGEKSYTAGMDITRNGKQYKCEVKDDHTEWVFSPPIDMDEHINALLDAYDSGSLSRDGLRIALVIVFAAGDIGNYTKDAAPNYQSELLDENKRRTKP